MMTPKVKILYMLSFIGPIKCIHPFTIFMLHKICYLQLFVFVYFYFNAKTLFLQLYMYIKMSHFSNFNYFQAIRHTNAHTLTVGYYVQQNEEKKLFMHITSQWFKKGKIAKCCLKSHKRNYALLCKTKYKISKTHCCATMYMG